MSSFKFGQKRFLRASKDFHKKRHVTDIFTNDVSKVVLPHRASRNNGKYWWYISLLLLLIIFIIIVIIIIIINTLFETGKFT